MIRHTDRASVETITDAAVGRLVSVNVGLPRDVSWRGRTVYTGIWKSPVSGPVTARRRNLDGDGQGDLAGHGGEMHAVMVYQLDSYRHWASEFGRDDFVHGQFGENFTIEGLPDDEVCIGDRYRIGGAVFEVTQPRVTCYRVGLRMNEPRMAALLVSHRRPGFYLRVLEEVAVEAGQEIVKLSGGPESLTVVDRPVAVLREPPPRPAGARLADRRAQSRLAGLLPVTETVGSPRIGGTAIAAFERDADTLSARSDSSRGRLVADNVQTAVDLISAQHDLDHRTIWWTTAIRSAGTGALTSTSSPDATYALSMHLSEGEFIRARRCSR